MGLSIMGLAIFPSSLALAFMETFVHHLATCFGALRGQPKWLDMLFDSALRGRMR